MLRTEPSIFEKEVEPPPPPKEEVMKGNPPTDGEDPMQSWSCQKTITARGGLNVTCMQNQVCNQVDTYGAGAMKMRFNKHIDSIWRDVCGDRE